MLGFIKQEKSTLLSRLKHGLERTRHQLGTGIANLLFGKKTIDAELLESLETLLWMADVGVTTTQTILQQLALRVSRKNLSDPNALLIELKELLLEILKPCESTLNIPAGIQPFVILVIGVNGTGKTTTIGKLAKQFRENQCRVMLAAGDTFRAAAIEQLQVWGQRNDVAVIAQQAGADAASVIFDAFESARAKNIDVLIADTAGRLHTKDNLMAELLKIKRVCTKIDKEAPHETLLVIDTATGQNAIAQAKEFQQSIGVTGIVLTKLDGTAKGGVIFAIAQQLGIPIKYIGIGESIDDLRAFNAHEFVEALFEHD